GDGVGVGSGLGSGLGSGSGLREEVTCSICLDVFLDPRTLSCGHSFCGGCLARHWEGGPEYRCPECRTRFPDRPQLGKSISLGRLCAALRAAPGPRAASLCRLHGRRLELYCRPDRSPICAECGIRQHRHHQLLTLQETAEHCGKLILKRRCEVEQRLNMTLRQISAQRDCSAAKQTCSGSAESGLVVSLAEGVGSARREETGFGEREVRAALSEVTAVTVRLERQRLDLSQELQQLQQLLNTEDQLQLIQGYQGVKLTEIWDVNEGLNAEAEVRRANPSKDPAELSGHLCKQLSVSSSPDPPSADTSHTDDISTSAQLEHPIQNRRALQQYLVQVRFNRDTVSEQLCLSDGDLIVRNVHPQMEDHPDHPDRFQVHSQALGTPALSSGRAYWEVRLVWDGKRNVKVGVASGDMRRKSRGSGSMLGRNSLSWCLHLSEHSLAAWHNNQGVTLGPGPGPGPGRGRDCRLGLLLDLSEGRLSFYQVTHDLWQIHSFQLQPCGQMFPAFFIGRENAIHLKP
ncbi:E3 ubiquitin/ISG15 ligase TRIM25-like, partial [Callorhinchus milii]|uniref:E3 ubiquitin/ISG15 ligase TRIM25-like n=1 Tax=Callorhinchus milii TaxID=7868 RepID=UPI001C3F77F0